MRVAIGRLLQISGLLVGLYGCIIAFRSETSEGQFIMLGFGGFAIFWLGTRLLGGRAT